jgi:integrase
VELKAGRNELGLIFADLDAGPLDRSVVLKCGLWPELKRAGLRRVTFHSLRDPYASGLITHGAPVNEVQKRLSHSDSSMMKVYSRWFRGVDRERRPSTWRSCSAGVAKLEHQFQERGS